MTRTRCARIPFYTVDGLTAEGCRHRHYTLSAAVKCLRKRERAYRQAGGYCDAEVWQVFPGGTVRLVHPREYDDRAAEAEAEWVRQEWEAARQEAAEERERQRAAEEEE